VQDAGDELDLLLHALGEFFALLAVAVGQGDAFEPVANFAFEACAVKALEAADVGQEVPHFHLLVQAALFGEVADAVLAFDGGLLAQDFDAAAVWEDDRHDHADGRGLARAVGADEADQGALGDGEVKVDHGELGAEALVDFGEADGVGHRCAGLHETRR
jgi:hypothetical protein